MSIVMDLFKPVDNVVCIGECPNSIIKMIWSDNENHDYIDFSDLRLIYRKERSWNRIANKFEGLPANYCPNGYSKGHIIIPVDRIQYAQGWFFKNRYFKRKCWYNVCNTKRGMIDFFNRYIDYSMDGAREATNKFINSWEDGMIFICSF